MVGFSHLCRFLYRLVASAEKSGENARGDVGNGLRIHAHLFNVIHDVFRHLPRQCV